MDNKKIAKNGMDFFQDQMTQKAVIAGVAFVVGFGAAWLWSGKSDRNASYQSDTQSTTEDAEPLGTQDKQGSASPSLVAPVYSGKTFEKQLPAASGDNAISLIDQSPGKSVMVSHITLARDGWVVIHEDKNGKPGIIIGAKKFKAGEYADQKILLIVRPSEGGKAYYGALRADDGNETFDFKTDTQLLDASGQPVMMKFMVTSK